MVQKQGIGLCKYLNKIGWFMVFNATISNISVMSWLSVLLMVNTTVLSQVTDKLYHMYNVVSSTPRHEQGSNFSGDRY